MDNIVFCQSAVQLGFPFEKVLCWSIETSHATRAENVSQFAMPLATAKHAGMPRCQDVPS